jgi:SAM-dependent methyltransferase
MTRVGLAYAHPYLYQGIMRLLHRGEFDERYTAIARHIPSGCSVVDLCCGDAVLARFVPRSCIYRGLDINPRFVAHGRRNGVSVEAWDAASAEVPEADVVCMQASLYHFLPNDLAMLERMVRAAKKRVIISEPVENWTSGTSLKRSIALALTSIGGQSFPHRHTEESLRAVVAQLPAKNVQFERIGRELVVIIDT